MEGGYLIRKRRAGGSPTSQPILKGNGEKRGGGGALRDSLRLGNWVSEGAPGSLLGVHRADAN